MTTLTLDLSDGEIWFVPCRYDGSLEDGRDPFTGQTAKVPRNAPLSAAERTAVASLVEGAQSPGGPTNIVKVADGGTAEIDVSPNAVMVKPRMVRPTAGLAALLYELLLAGKWSIRTDDAFVVANAEHARLPPGRDSRVPDGFYEGFPENVVTIESAAALADALGWNSPRR